MKSYYPWLDLLRFGSALSVAFFHQMFWSWAGDVRGFDRFVFADAQFPSAVTFTWFGWVGVEVFFVISGFVIANSANNASPVEFLVSRALRLYPAVWVCSSATLLVLLFFATGSFTEFVGPYVRSMLLIPRGPWIDGVFWTLTAELSFYALVFVLLLSHRLTLLHLAWALTIYSGLFNAFQLFVTLELPASSLYWFLIWHRATAAILLSYHGCFFALGIWFWVASKRDLAVVEQLGLAIAFVAGTMEIFNFSSASVAHLAATSGQSPLVPVAVFAGAMCIVGVAARESRRSTREIVPAASYFRTLGLITYPLYLTHNTVGAAIARVLMAVGLDATLAVWAALGGLIALCWLFCSNFEPVLRALLKQLFSYFGLLPASGARRAVQSVSTGLPS
jgi:peptidoglycan/LPS O-acetylase OafA/YrhL